MDDLPCFLHASSALNRMDALLKILPRNFRKPNQMSFQFTKHQQAVTGIRNAFMAIVPFVIFESLLFAAAKGFALLFIWDGITRRQGQISIGYKFEVILLHPHNFKRFFSMLSV